MSLLRPCCYSIKRNQREMEGAVFSSMSDGAQVDAKMLQTFQKSFLQVQNILDQNRLLINEINQNHESKMPDNLSRNVGLIRELNNNIRRVVDVYSGISASLVRSAETTSEGESRSNGKSNTKRLRSG
ncbi:hypothetical protein SAY87_029123 [Trapa incisa]|uniref:Protein EARLY FLOWERING 4 domain-containing protein n=1 Tax=Trapa incisa TaxID=236973 RepID=A0AAN7KZ27_9MYRT|nr:hypothetical protein SAY87_029123 [Trapa incisa]